MSDLEEGKRICLGSKYKREVGDSQDLMPNILSKLNVKHILRCKTVAKMWKVLIGEHGFPKMHFSNSRKTPKLIAFIYDYEEAPADPGPRLYLIEENGHSMPFPRFRDSFRNGDFFCVEGSFNGLICGSHEIEGETIIWICNPFTEEYHVLPRGSEFDSDVAPYVFVVFDSETRKYKVVRFFYDGDKFYKCELYNPGVEAWTRVGDMPYPEDLSWPSVWPSVWSAFHSYVNVGRRVYWLVVRDRDNVESDYLPYYILSIDIDGHYSRVKLPEPVFRNFHPSAVLVEFKNQLLLITVDDTEDGYFIWTLQDHYLSTWCFRHVSNVVATGGMISHRSIVALNDELLFVVKPPGAQYFQYHMLNMEKITWRELQVSPELRENEPTVFPFTESLFKCNVACD